MNSIFHGRSYGNIAAATQTHIVVTTNTMLVITCHSQCTRTAKNKLSFTKKASFFIFARYGGVRRSICQIVFRFRLHFYKNTLAGLDIDCRPAVISQRNTRKSQFKLLITVYLERAVGCRTTKHIFYTCYGCIYCDMCSVCGYCNPTHRACHRCRTISKCYLYGRSE